MPPISRPHGVVGRVTAVGAFGTKLSLGWLVVTADG
jgi:hypothetical protein